MNLSPTMTAALAYLKTATTGSNAGKFGYVKTATAKALQARGLVYATPAKPGDTFARGYMRCVLA